MLDFRAKKESARRDSNGDVPENTERMRILRSLPSGLVSKVSQEKVDFYVFTLDPAIDEVLVDVYAVIEKEKTPADALTGITLKVDETVVDVKKNDTYKIEKQP